ncbi:MAG: hypothetical protein AAB436_03475 [Patescibacteria group bacterium]
MLILWLALLGLIAANRQDIIDWYKLRQYQAPAPVSQLATESTMTDFARKVFYVNAPAIQDKASFAKECLSQGNKQEQTIVLGCYHSNQNGIFLMKVSDPRLNGVQQVTAAHEMLHGAYDRLNSSDRSKVDAMLMDYYKNDLHDQRIIDTIAAYKKSEPNDIVNEMHSIFGSEVSNLPSGLEQYYKRYFSDRAQVVAFADQYQAEFTSRQTVVAQADAKLDILKQQISDSEASLKSQQATIEAKKNALNSLKASGDFAAYNAGVVSYNVLVNVYNGEVGNLRSLISQYNSLVASRNATALEANQLSKELSNDTATIN